jgi:hypothetical protein
MLPLDPERQEPVTAWAAVSGACLERPKFTDTTVHVGLYEPEQNPNGSGTIFVPAWVLRSESNVGDGRMLAEAVGRLSVFADGTLCLEAELTSEQVLDEAGNARIRVGADGQPAACRREGARLTFRRGDGAALVESRSLIPGVTQPLANFGPEAPGSGSRPGPSGATPRPPAAGQAVEVRTEAVPWRIGALALGLAGVVGATWVLARWRR